MGKSGGEGEKEKTSKGPWKSEEDQKLRELIEEHGTANWSVIAKEMDGRNGKSCRLRWFNQLCPELKKESFSPQEDMVIIESHAFHGNKWSLIAKMLPGRTDNGVKNRWNSTLKRRVSVGGGNSATYAAAHCGGRVAPPEVGKEMEEIEHQLETVDSVFEALKEQAKNGHIQKMDFAAVMEHLCAARSLMIQAQDGGSGPTASGVQQNADMPIHFEDDNSLRSKGMTQQKRHNSAAWDNNPMRRLPGLAPDAKDVAARALEGPEEDDEAFSSQGHISGNSSDHGYHSPDLNSPSHAVTHLGPHGSSSHLRPVALGHADFGESYTPQSNMSASANSLQWANCARQMSVTGGSQRQFMHSLDTIGSDTPSQMSADYQFHHQQTVPQAQLLRRYSAPVPGLIRLEQPEPMAPMQSVDPIRMQLQLHAEMQRGGKRRRSDEFAGSVYNPFNNFPDGGEFAFFKQAPSQVATQGIGPMHESVDSFEDVFGDSKEPTSLAAADLMNASLQ